MKWLYFSILVLIFISCQKDVEIEPLYTPQLMEIPKGFHEIEFPGENEFSMDRWNLGKRLFFDKNLSVDSTLSCASCHKPALAFSDDKAFSPGVQNRPGTRNSPTLANIAYHPYFTREGGVPTLEMQVQIPIQEHNEFDFNIVLIAERLIQDEKYASQAISAYDRTMDAFVITRALANFERSLLSGYSPYDQFINYEKENALTAEQISGMDLFFSDKTNCSSCHSGFNFSNYTFENNGLYEEYADEGRFKLTGLESDRSLFKVPSLRNIELTAPYMHDGSIQSLEEVIEHYNNGGKGHSHKSNLIQKMNLTETEKSDLTQFLKALTDETFISNPLFTN